jgi:uncharacterized protein DUF1707
MRSCQYPDLSGGDEMVDQQELRASDRDRQQVVERLRGALEDGRLTMAEYVDRVGVAYQAATYGDLAPLYADLPAPIPAPASAPGPAGPGAAAAPPAATSRAGGGLAGLPLVLKVLWTVWLVAVSVNVVVWILVRDPGGHLSYPWPLWVAGPYGAVLFAVSASVILFRRSRPPVSCRCGS